MGEQRLQDERDKQNEHLVIRAIEARDDAAIARIIRHNLEAYGLDRPGTAYFDPELDHLSRYYSASPHRAYFIAELDGTVVGGAGASPVPGATGTAELQKLYVAPEAQRRGIATALTLVVEDFARRAGFSTLHLETHHGLTAAIALYRALSYAEDDKPLPGSPTPQWMCSSRKSYRRRVATIRGTLFPCHGNPNASAETQTTKKERYHGIQGNQHPRSATQPLR